MELMITKTAPRPSTRLNKGNAVLANARTVDTKPVKSRFNAFVEVHRRYLEGQGKVEEGERLVRVEQTRLEELDAVQDNAITALSIALQSDGEARHNPFARFTSQSPRQIADLPFGEEAQAIHALALTLRNSASVSAATVAVAEKAEQAAVKVEEALPGWELRRQYLGDMRQERDSLMPEWDAAYSALRHAAKSMIERPLLYSMLFRRPRTLHKAKPASEDGAVAQPTTPVAETPPSNAPSVGAAEVTS